MTLSRNVAEIIRQHVTLEVESIDRMYLNGIVNLTFPGDKTITVLQRRVRFPSNG